VATLQLVGSFPTGDARRGLGTDHVAVQPGVLLYQGLPLGFALEGQFSYVTPVGAGSRFAGDVLSYGLGVKYDLYADEELALMPVVEVFGWTFLDGSKTLVQPDGTGLDVSAGGDTIVNAAAGLRLHLGALGDLYGGYGHALTGTARYHDITRVEWRLAF
jgi:hypothetical protein